MKTKTRKKLDCEADMQYSFSSTDFLKNKNWMPRCLRNSLGSGHRFVFPIYFLGRVVTEPSTSRTEISAAWVTPQTDVIIREEVCF